MSKKAMYADKDAMKAMEKEWKGLLEKGVLNVTKVLDWIECASMARAASPSLGGPRTASPLWPSGTAG